MPSHLWRRRRLVEPEASVPLEPDTAGFQATDRLGSPEAEVGSAPLAEQVRPREGDRAGHHRQHRPEEARP